MKRLVLFFLVLIICFNLYPYYKIIKKENNVCYVELQDTVRLKIISLNNPQIKTRYSKKNFIKKVYFREIPVYVYEFVSPRMDTVKIIPQGLMKKKPNRYIYTPPGVINPEASEYFYEMPNRLKSSENTLPQYNAVLSFKEEGIYRVTYDDFVSHGLPTSFDPRTLQVYRKGYEIPIYFYGEDDGVFNKGDYFEFYGDIVKGDNTYFDPYTDSTFYYVKWGENRGFRLFDMNIEDSSDYTPYSYDTTYHFERDSFYMRVMSEPDTFDCWGYYRIVPEETINVEFDLPSIDTSSISYLKVVAVGGTSYERTLRVYLNGFYVGEYIWSSYLADTILSAIPENILKENKDTLTLILLPNDDNPPVAYLNYFEITGKALYKASNNLCIFKAPYNGTPQTVSFDISGFDNSDITVYKLNEYKIDNISVTTDNDGTFYCNFKDKVYRDNTWYMAFGINAVKTPTIRSAMHTDFEYDEGYDLVIIAPQRFLSHLARYKALKENEGVSTLIISEEEIRDHFDYGRPSAEGIKEFIKYTYYNWEHPPLYVMIVGTGSADLANRTPYRGKSVMPLKLAFSEDRELQGSDAWLGDIINDKVPEVCVGRIPVYNEDELDRVLDKLISYYTSSVKGIWHINLSFVSNDDIPISSFLIDAHNYLPDIYRYKTVIPDVGGSSQDVFRLFEEGTVLLNYIGHGNPIAINLKPDGMTINEIPLLRNIGKLPVFLSVSCNNIALEWPYDVSIAEAFVRTPGVGSIAFWGAVKKSNASDGNHLEKGMFDYMGNNYPVRLGDMINSGYLEYPNSGIYFYSLVGDPSMAIAIPSEGRLFVDKTSAIPGDTITLYYPIKDAVGTFYIANENDSVLSYSVANSYNTDTIRAQLVIPNDYSDGTAILYMYVENDSDKIASKKIISVNCPYVDTFYNVPDVPEKGDSVYIYAKITSREGVKYVMLFYKSENAEEYAFTQMREYNDTLYRSLESLPMYGSGTTVQYYIQVKDTLERIYNTPIQTFTVKTEPDISTTPIFIHLFNDTLSFIDTLVNNGELSSDSFFTFLRIIDEDTVWGDTTYTSIEGLSSDVVHFPINTSIRGKYYLYIKADATSLIPEPTEINNTYITPYKIQLNFYKFPEDTIAYSLDSILVISPMDTDAYYLSMLDDSVASTFQRYIEFPNDTLCYNVEIFSGDSLVHEIDVHATYPYDSTYTLYYYDTLSGLWIYANNTPVSYEGKYTFARSMDKESPYIEGQIYSSYYVNNVYIYDQFIMDGIIEDNGGIDNLLNRPLAIMDNDTLDTSEFNIDYSPKDPTHVNFHIRKRITNGNHVLKIVCSDIYGNVSEKTYNITVNLKLRITDIANHPNPVTGNNTLFRFYLTENADRVSLEIYSASGKLIYTEERYNLPKGFYTWNWNLKDNNGIGCSNGVYFYKFSGYNNEDSFISTLKTMVIGR